MYKFSCSKLSFTSLAALTIFLPVSACDLATNLTKIDRTTNSEFQDYRDALAPRQADMENSAMMASNGPELEDYVADDVVNAKPMPLVSIAINQSIPLREALFELAKQADYDVELDPRIKGSIIFTARNRPFDEVIDKICEISGLRYKLDDTSMRIELDTPYSQNYKVDYLSFVRKNQSNVKTDVSVASGSGESGGVGGGSQFVIDSKSESDFWAELDLNIKQILASNASGNYLRTSEDPVLALTATAPSPTAVNPPVPPVDAAALGDVTPHAGGRTSDYISSPQMVTQENQTTPTATTAPASEAGAAAPAQAVNPAAAAPVVDPAAPQSLSGQQTPAQAPVLKVESLPTALSAGGDANQNDVVFTPAYSINKQAGIISVYANERVQKKVADYLVQLKRATTSQVLIEAKVLEVSLTDEFAAGINWDLVRDIGDFGFTGTFAKPVMNPTTTNVVTFGFAGSDLSSFVSALSRFGTVHALASPRLTVLNNQSSVLNVAQNQVYFEVDVDRTEATVNTPASTTVDTTIKTVPEGVLINVLPSINLDDRVVSLQVRPTVTKIKGFVEDPGVAFVAASSNIDIASNIPIVNVQEVDSVLNIKSGEMMVMGGLLQDNVSSTQEGLPVASEIPVLGSLFRNQGDKAQKTELVIFLKATILDSASDSIHQTDRELYRTFSQDRRPTKL